jgi:diguanylate cyclase (GGDEF)-like protein
LTGLYNHSTTIELLRREVEHGKRYEFSTAVMMIDIDEFKSSNDNYGRPVGDKVFFAVSRTLTNGLRSADIVGRYGGDEFLIALSHADVTAAKGYGDRPLSRIRNIVIPQMGSHNVTVSLAISILSASSEDLSTAELIRRADEAIYKSKRTGRDRPAVANPSLIVANEV